MIQYLHEGNDTEPRILFNKENNIFEISGNARSENFYESFLPVFKWIKEYNENPNPETILKCKIYYCNTSSSKQLFEIIKSLQECTNNGSTFRITWEHEIDDDDMIYLGKSISELLEIPCELIGTLEL